ncbi:hypothetical protein GCK32_020585, partial [Trichostrongylus colubriformis]
MRGFAFALMSIVSTVLHDGAASDPWPNGTETAFRWWQCNDGPLLFLDAKLYDETGKEEYPVHLNKPLIVESKVINPTTVYGSPDLRLSVRLWSWGPWKKVYTWLPLPTLGLLDNLDACKHGIKCPVPLGHQTTKVVVDFTKISS